MLFSKKKLSHIGDLFENNGKMRSWEDLKAKLGLDHNRKCYWRQVIHEIPCAWKEMFLECGENINDLIIDEHHLLKKHQIYCLENLNSRETYDMQTYFEKKFQKPELNWKYIYIYIYIYIPYLDV